MVQQIILLSSRAAAQNRVGTIKIRHLEGVLDEFKSNKNGALVEVILPLV